MKTALALLLLAGVAPLAPAGIGVETYGTAAPPTTLGSSWMHSAPLRTDLYTDVFSTPLCDIVPSMVVYFSDPVSVRQIGAGWATWSHGYTGNCFYTNGFRSLTMTFGDWGISAFQFYAEPNPFGVFQMTATGSDGTTAVSSQQFPDGAGGAVGWGFYGTHGSRLMSVAIRCDVDFAVGEFAHGFVPGPASLSLLALGGLVVGRRR
ncbi:MAG: hypothetical protein IT436_13170 [Phycisphaerales bacterium]|nr:hypothetical protein [Phycisphaerales bacterium]